MPVYLNQLSVQTRIITADRRQDLGLLDEHPMVSVVVHRPLWLAQTAAEAVFTHAGLDAVLCGAYIDLATRAGHTVDAA